MQKVPLIIHAELRSKEDQERKTVQIPKAFFQDPIKKASELPQHDTSLPDLDKSGAVEKALLDYCSFSIEQTKTLSRTIDKL